MRPHHPEPVAVAIEPLDVHLAPRTVGEIDERAEGEMAVIAPVAVGLGQAVHPRGFVAGEEQAVACARGGGEILVYWIINVIDRLVMPEAENQAVFRVGHGHSVSCGAWRTGPRSLAAEPSS